MDINKKIQEHKKEIDKRLEKYLEKKLKHAIKESEAIDYITELAGYIKEYNLRGGKRIRPTFIIEGYRSVGGKDINSIYDASLCVETMEGFLLTHDDVMDRDDMRRGGKTIHKIYEEWFLKNIKKDKKEAEHFGNTMAIDLGDIMETFGPEILASSNFPEQRKIEAIKKYTTMSRYTGYGQALDLIVEKLPLEKVTEKHIITVHKFKTSLYTITGPLQIGVILAGGTKHQQKIMEKYGENLGIAFQIQDDLLGIYADEKKLGKPIGSDLKSGKRTLLVIKALEKATQKQKEKLKKLIGKKDITNQEIEEAKKIIKDTGSYDYSKKLAVEYAQKAIQAIEKEKLEQEGKEYLLDIAEYLIKKKLLKKRN